MNNQERLLRAVEKYLAAKLKLRKVQEFYWRTKDELRAAKRSYRAAFDELQDAYTIAECDTAKRFSTKGTRTCD